VPPPPQTRYGGPPFLWCEIMPSADMQIRLLVVTLCEIMSLQTVFQLERDVEPLHSI
jgi:hypothetical protein